VVAAAHSVGLRTTATVMLVILKSREMWLNTMPLIDMIGPALK
jgi:2-iminoacetate synthase ThiH